MIFGEYTLLNLLFFYFHLLRVVLAQIFTKKIDIPIYEENSK